MARFRNMLNLCNLHDLGFKGKPWTYNNKQRGDKNVKARIDYDVASPCWQDCFKQATVTHITTQRSDHFPLLLNYSGQANVWGWPEAFHVRVYVG